MPAAAIDLEAARQAHPLWAVLPVAARARYLRRAAVALIDELDELAPRLADETGWPVSQLMVSELLPAARGLSALADDGPRALADTRLTPRALLLAGRSTRVVQSPVGLVGVRGPSASPFAEPLLETAAALLAGNAVVLAAVVPRLRAIFLRAGIPGELLMDAPEDTDLDALCRRVIDLPRPGRRGMLLVLAGAPRERVVEAAVWAGFGRHPAAAGRLVMVRDAVPGLVAALEEAASALRVGDPRDPDTDIAADTRGGDDAPGPPRRPAPPCSWSVRTTRASSRPPTSPPSSWSRRRTARRRSSSPCARPATRPSRSGRVICRRASGSRGGCRRRRRGSGGTGSRPRRCRPGSRATSSHGSWSGGQLGPPAPPSSPPIRTSLRRSER